MVTKFEDNFWGESNRGFEILLQNMKASVIASKELGDFVKERVAVEETYMKGLAKLHKFVYHTPGINLGGFAPLWEVITQMCDQLSNFHSQFVKMLTEVSREIMEYNVSQKDKMKMNFKGEIELAQEALLANERTETALQRTKKQYQQSVDHLAKAKFKQEKAASDPTVNARTKSQVESRYNQAQLWMETMKGDHQAATKDHCERLMDFQGKMVEASQKFESLEEEHLAQMVTFMLKMAKTQDTHHVRTERVLAKVNEQLDIMSVEFLLGEVVKSKGTGRDKPIPYKFKPLQLPVPTGGMLSVSTEDLRSSSPTGAGTRTQSKGEKGFKSFLRKRNRKNPNASGDASNDSPQLPSPNPVGNVDEEGYSIRPEDAASISYFPDEVRAKKDESESDSDFGDDSDSQIKKITIRQSAEKPQATVDDIKASVMSLRLQPVSQGMRKATSSQSLNVLATPPNSHKEVSSNSSQDILQKSDHPSMASLLDIDITLSGNSSQLGQMPPPLLPQASLPPQVLAPLVQEDPNPNSTLRPWSLKSSTTPSISTIDPSSSSKALNIPQADSSLKIHPQQPLSSGNRNVSEPAVAMLPSRLLSNTVQRTSSEPGGPFLEPEAVSIPPACELRTQDGNLPNMPMKPSSEYSSNTVQCNRSLVPVEISNGSSSPLKLESSQVPSSCEEQTFVLPPPASPLPAPGRTSTALKQRVFNNSAADLGVISPLTLSSRSATVSPTLIQKSRSSQPSVSGIPLAIAVRETCNAKFSGSDVKKCISKMTGEVIMSFPSAFVTQLASCEPLSFKLAQAEKVEKLLHNQLLLKRDPDNVQFRFNMAALLSHLKLMKEKHTSPFYNVQLIKYEVKGDLPLKLVCYWKCESTVTNFRLDYSYLPSSMKTMSGERKPLSNLVISVAVDGVVRNALSKPSGQWSSEQSKMIWTLGAIPPETKSGTMSLHAKFDIASGPSVPAPAKVQFDCDGATLSGLSLDLCSDAYRLSLIKNNCISGQYVVGVNA